MASLLCALFRLFRLAAEALRYPIPLGLCGHGPTDKRRDRLSGLLSGLLGRRQRFRGKDGPAASVRFCGLLSGIAGKPPHCLRKVEDGSPLFSVHFDLLIY